MHLGNHHLVPESRQKLGTFIENKAHFKNQRFKKEVVPYRLSITVFVNLSAYGRPRRMCMQSPALCFGFPAALLAHGKTSKLSALSTSISNFKPYNHSFNSSECSLLGNWGSQTLQTWVYEKHKFSNLIFFNEKKNREDSTDFQH